MADALLFDFFGTLVSYSPSWTEQGFHKTHAVVRSYGCALEYQQFLDEWSRVISRFAEEAAITDREYSLNEVSEAFLRAVLSRNASAAEVDELLASYMAEWNTGVTHLDGIPSLLQSLAERYRLAIISNTNEPRLVPHLLEAMGVLSCFQSLTLSIELGWRKPNPAIFTAALDSIGVDASRAIVVGDSYLADYLGAKRSGIRGLLIDPDRLHPIPPKDRLSSVFEIAALLEK